MYDGEAKTIEVSIGDWSVQLSVDDYGSLVFDILNVVTGRAPTIGNDRLADDSLELLINP